MRVWHDPSVFENAPVALFKSAGMEKHYASPEKQGESPPEAVIMPPRPSWAMLWPLAVYREIKRYGAHLRRSYPDFLAIEHLHEGVMYFREEGRMYLIEPGDTFLMHPRRNNEFLIPDDVFSRKTALFLSGPLLDDLLLRNGLGSVDVLSGVDAARFESMLNMFGELSNSRGRSAQNRISALSYEMLQDLAHREPEESIPPELEALLAHMEENASKQLTLRLLARRYGCSVAQLIRLFNRCLGQTPHHALMQMRMRLAMQLLAKRRFSVKVVAARAGYQHAKGFTAEFKRMYGITPKEWRIRFST